MKSPNSGKFAIVDVKVSPGAHHDSIDGWKEERLCIRLRQVPEKGQANRKLLQFLAKELGIAASRLQIVSGGSSRFKRLRIEGLTRDEIIFS